MLLILKDECERVLSVSLFNITYNFVAFTILFTLIDVISLTLQGIMKKFNGIRLEQMINLLLCRGDMSRSEARQMILDTVGEEEALKVKHTGLFAEIATETK